jgi:hypothetical protein
MKSLGELPYECRVIERGSFANEILVIEQEKQYLRDVHLLSAGLDPYPLDLLRTPQTSLYD